MEGWSSGQWHRTVNPPSSEFEGSNPSPSTRFFPSIFSIISHAFYSQQGHWQVCMSEIINLNKKRKAKMRVEKEVRSQENRLKYGRTKQEKKAEQLKARKLDLHMQGHKRETKED